MKWVWLGIGTLSLALLWAAYFVTGSTRWEFFVIELFCFYMYSVEKNKTVEERSE